MGWQMAELSLRRRFWLRRTPFRHTEASPVSEWVPDALRGPNPRRNRLLPPRRSWLWSGIDLLRPSEASDGSESRWPWRNGAGQDGRAFW